MVGRTVTLDGEPYDVIGVAAPRFSFPDGAVVWAPLALFDDAAASRHPLSDRLRPPGHRPDVRRRAGADVGAGRTARARYPEAHRDHGIDVYTLAEGMWTSVLAP